MTLLVNSSTYLKMININSPNLSKKMSLFFQKVENPNSFFEGRITLILSQKKKKKERKKYYKKSKPPTNISGEN